MTQIIIIGNIILKGISIDIKTKQNKLFIYFLK
jgi:hypothetical protein